MYVRCVSLHMDGVRAKARWISIKPYRSTHHTLCGLNCNFSFMDNVILRGEFCHLYLSIPLLVITGR